MLKSVFSDEMLQVLYKYFIMFLKSNAKVFCFPSASTKNETPIIGYVQDIFLTLLILSMSMTHVTNVNLHVICTVADTEKRGAVDLPAL